MKRKQRENRFNLHYPIPNNDIAALVVRIWIICPIQTICPKWSNFWSDFDFWSKFYIVDIGDELCLTGPEIFAFKICLENRTNLKKNIQFNPLKSTSSDL